jgi:hypothetical protein
MNCTQVQEQLSDYFDGELPPKGHRAVAEHLQRCSRCAAELAAFGELSSMAKQLTQPEMPELWTALEQQLDAESGMAPRTAPASDPLCATERGTRPNGNRLRRHRRLLGLAALLLIGVGIGSLAIHEAHRRGREREMAAKFHQYLDAFDQDPERAHQILLASYPARQVDPNEPARELRHRPAVSKLPPGYRLQTTYLVDMPCCQCVHALCRRADGSLLAVIEHDASQAVSYGNRPCHNAQCNGRETCFAQLNDRLAATWEADGHFITVIGARDADEVSLLMSHLRDGQT